MDFCKFDIKLFSNENLMFEHHQNYLACMGTCSLKPHFFKLPSGLNAEVTFITATSLPESVNNLNMECDWLMAIQEIFLEKY